MHWNIICFDLDNTLFSHEQAFEKAISFCFDEKFEELKSESSSVPYIKTDQWFYFFKKHSDEFWEDLEEERLTLEEYRKKRYEETMRIFGLPIKENDASRFQERYQQVVGNFSTPFEGLYDFLDTLKKQNVKLGIITNGGKETQQKKVDNLGLESYIPKEHIIISEEAQVEKPDKAIFDLALKKMGEKNLSPLFIGDSWLLDVAGAIDAGWDAIFLNTRGEEPLTSHHPILECKTLKDTAGFIYERLGLKEG
ncbi:HAD family hydrolase [Bacillus sp. FJAT-44742]|uniref:HAD family hydrolase n=1 Tax=Bacillus sp. FJAT-44742 TaxID=2014005 RepID=UPI000C23F3C2|nr:HAD family hydrolase [Bacillus sp. FJAT-44742]